MKYIKIVFILLLAPLALSAKVSIVSTTSDLAYFAGKIGGELVDVSFIAPPASDIHSIEARPSYMIKVAKANIVLKVGLELDLWIDPIIDGSRNSHLTIVDCSKYIKPLEVPSFKADARYGDLHRFGNPHYWLSPENAKPISDAIVEGLARVDPEHNEQFAANRDQLLQEIISEIEKLQPKLAQLKGTPIVFYHNSWPYFDKFTGTKSFGFIEPFPGVAPSPSHIKKLIDLIKAGDSKIIAIEPYFDHRVPEKLARETGAKVVTVYPSIGGRSEKETYQEWFEGNVDALLNAKR